MRDRLEADRTDVLALETAADLGHAHQCLRLVGFGRRYAQVA